MSHSSESVHEAMIRRAEDKYEQVQVRLLSFGISVCSAAAYTVEFELMSDFPSGLWRRIDGIILSTAVDMSVKPLLDFLSSSTHTPL